MFCSNCGKELEAGDLFCGYCGARQEPVQAPQESPAVEEPAAGNEGPAVGAAAQGTQANEEATSSQVASAAPVPGKKSPVVPIVIAVLLVAGAGAGFMLWRNSGVSPKLYYDGAGNVTRLENYGVFGRLVAGSDGVAIYEWEYDKAGNRIRQECYGVDGRLTLNSNGVAIYEYEYDSAGNCIRTEYYKVDGRLTDGVAIVEWEYDSAGNVVETRTYDVQGRRVN